MPPIHEIVELVALLAIAGAIAGFLAGLFGIGGGAVLVPVFYQAFAMAGVADDIRMKLCVGTSLAIIIPTSLRSFQSHYKRGAVDMTLLRKWIIAVPFGAVASTLVIAYAPGALLRGVFAVLTLLIGLKMLYPKSAEWRLGDDLPENPALFGYGWFIGLLSGLIGIGGGTLNNTFMTLFNRPIHQAVATSAGVGVLISLPSFIGNIVGGWAKPGLPALSTGYVNWVAVALIIPITFAIAPLGVRAAHALTKRQLSFGFGIFLLIISARFFYSFF
ncbi:sulfite exporter TauE/SafE family protein [Martelella endophytica]|uniref:Probable membrane transporter protein n=1 Tax=Martelella endophytica TaxID=1486262 RepID=A0A0D5LXK9_MAREN|nr:sulfite exporter TauE/SafE family protein [Martelella endophytica]AJY48198.1 membrane protein [Martelella endophytica]